MLVTGAVCQYVLTFTGVRIPLVTGLVLVSGGLFCYTRRTPDASYAAGMLPGLLLTAAGAGLAWQLLFLVATAKVRPEESGLASGLVNSAQQVGGAIGLAALAVVVALLGVRADDIQHAPEPELTAVVDAELGSEATVPVEP